MTGLLVAPALQAQVQGTIFFKETMKMQINLDSNMRAMLGDLPTENSMDTELLFNETVSLYRNTPKKEDPSKEIEQGNGRRVVINMGAADEKVYCDLKNNRILEEREFMGKKFLIDTAMTKQEWKLTGKQKSILNYPCQQAMKIENKDTTMAWFTPAIQVSTGPMGVRSLPGMVLELEADHGNLKIVAQKAEMTKPDAAALTKPKEGKKVTPAQFRKTVEEKTKEMQMEHGGGGGNVIIQVERR